MMPRSSVRISSSDPVSGRRPSRPAARTCTTPRHTIRTAPGCNLRVGNEVREWIDGVPLVFDDSIEHEARNAGDQSRTVLLFEIWRPEINEEERAALADIFAAIGDFAD